jgi:hypothetical protein
MDSLTKHSRAAVILAPGEGRSYSMGRMRAVFKADLDETESKDSVSSVVGRSEHARPRRALASGGPRVYRY